MSSLRYRAHEIIDNISEKKIAEVIDFLEYLKVKEEVETANEILNDKKMLEAIQKGLLEVESGNLIHLEEVIDSCINADEGLLDNNVDFVVSRDLEDIWGKTLDIIKKELTEVSFNTWLAIIKLLSIGGDVIRLGVPSEFDKGIIECRYIELLKTALSSITGRNFEIELSVIGYEEKKAVQNKEATVEVDKKWSSLNPKYSAGEQIARNEG